MFDALFIANRPRKGVFNFWNDLVCTKNNGVLEYILWLWIVVAN